MSKYIDCSDETLKVLVSVERRLNTIIGLAETACGHEVYLRRARIERTKLMNYLERAMEKMQGGGK